MKSAAADIILVRHATAEPPKVGLTDAQRKLSEQGVHEAHGVADTVQRICMRALHNVQILSSPYARTMQTATIISERLNVDVTTDTALGADRHAQDMIDCIASSTASPLMVVGHMPTLSEVISRLLDVQTPLLDIPPATIVGMRWESRQRRLAILQYILTPAVFQRITASS